MLKFIGIECIARTDTFSKLINFLCRQLHREALSHIRASMSMIRASVGMIRASVVTGGGSKTSTLIRATSLRASSDIIKQQKRASACLISASVSVIRASVSMIRASVYVGKLRYTTTLVSRSVYTSGKSSFAAGFDYNYFQRTKNLRVLYRRLVHLCLPIMVFVVMINLTKMDVKDQVTISPLET
ncbi:hypothetical protein Tco_0420636 [Tanacetum coccineum]